MRQSLSKSAKLEETTDKLVFRLDNNDLKGSFPTLQAYELTPSENHPDPHHPVRVPPALPRALDDHDLHLHVNNAMAIIYSPPAPASPTP